MMNELSLLGVESKQASDSDHKVKKNNPHHPASKGSGPVRGLAVRLHRPINQRKSGVTRIDIHKLMCTCLINIQRPARLEVDLIGEVTPGPQALKGRTISSR